MISNSQVWAFLDPTSKSMILPFLLEKIDLLISRNFIPYVFFIIVLVAGFGYMFMYWVFVRILYYRILAVIPYVAVFVWRSYSYAPNGFSYALPALIPICSIILGRFAKCNSGKSADNLSPGVLQYSVNTPFLSSMDGCLLLGLVYVLISAAILYALPNNHLISMTLGMGLVLICLQRAPSIGSNSSATTMIILAILLIIMYSPFGTVMLRFLERMTQVVAPSVDPESPPIYRIDPEPITSAQNFLQELFHRPHEHPNGISYMLRILLGIFLQVILCLDEILGPGIAVKTASQTNSKTENVNTGIVSNMTSPWVICLFIQLLWAMLNLNPLLIMCHVLALVFAIPIWYMTLRQTWAGRGALVGLTRMNPMIRACVGDGPSGMRKFILTVVAGISVLIYAVHVRNADTLLRVATLVIGTGFMPVQILLCGVTTANIGLLITMMYYGREVLVEAMNRNSIVGVDMGADGPAAGGNSGPPEPPAIVEPAPARIGMNSGTSQVDEGLDITSVVHFTPAIDLTGNIIIHETVDKQKEAELISWARKTKHKLIWRNTHGIVYLRGGEDYYVLN